MAMFNIKVKNSALLMVSTHIAIYDQELNSIAQGGNGPGKNTCHASLLSTYPTLSTDV